MKNIVQRLGTFARVQYKVKTQTTTVGKGNEKDAKKGLGL